MRVALFSVAGLLAIGFLAIAPLGGCSGDEPVGDAGNGSNDLGEPAELAGTLAAHNQVRNQVGLPPLTWDPALAATARAWAMKCEDREAPAGLIDHNEGRSDGHSGYVGENIFGSSGDATGPMAVSSWAAESADYNYPSNQCTGVCGHYTQLVWRETLRVGCALYRCASLRFSSTVVCNYAPGGNTSGRRPY